MGRPVLDVTDFIAYGDNLDPAADAEEAVAAILAKLERRLGDRGRTWHDVSLLILANSFPAPSRADQERLDRTILATLTRFCGERAWFPSLIGTTVFASFFSDQGPAGERRLDISDGLQFVAVVTKALDLVPVSAEVSASVADRSAAGLNVVRACSRDFDEVIASNGRPAQSRTGILFTSGSGHVAAGEIDFNECYALGQELLGGLRADPPNIVGGCASSKSPEYYQCLYYSVREPGGDTRYDSTYQHAAVFALIPNPEARYLLQHPFQHLAKPVPLTIKWDDKDKYANGRYYYVESINGSSPVDFLADYWEVPKDELLGMEEKHTPIPLDWRTFLYTVASSRRAGDRHIWPNVPVWFEKVRGKTMLRLVRAEEHTSNFYLMVMGEDARGTLRHGREQALQENCVDLVNQVRKLSRQQDVRTTTLSFLCESRKVLLKEWKTNMEADYLADRLPSSAQIIGIYLNGEYSVGSPGSIGYHNFSQISAIIPHEPATVSPDPALPGHGSEFVSVPETPPYQPGSTEVSKREELNPMQHGPAERGEDASWQEEPASPPQPVAPQPTWLPQQPVAGPQPLRPVLDPARTLPAAWQETAPGGPTRPGPLPVQPPVHGGSVPGQRGPLPPRPHNGGAVTAPRGPLPPSSRPASAIPASGVPISAVPISGPGSRSGDDLTQAMHEHEQAADLFLAAARERQRAAELHELRNQAAPAHVDPHVPGEPGGHVRLVVTGTDVYGQTTAQELQLTPSTSVGLPGAAVYYVWGADTPPMLTPGGHEADYEGHFPRPGGARHILLDLAPYSSVLAAEALTPQYQADAAATFPGLLETAHGRTDGLHRSDSVDIAVVVAGQVVLELDNTEVHLTAGNVVVQNGTWHRWANRAAVPARLVFMHVGAYAPPPGGPGHR